MRNELGLTSSVLLALLLSGSVMADSMAVPTVEFREERAGRYLLEAQMAPALVASARTPVPPERCLVGDASRVEQSRGVVLSFVVDCGDAPLRFDDVIVLPWSVDGIQLTARWLDGRVRRGLFGRGPMGVVVRLDRILDRDESFGDLFIEHAFSGVRHALGRSSHWLFALALALAVSGSARLASGALGGWLFGHALALILTDLGVSGLALDPAEALVAGVAALLLAGATRDRVSKSALVTATALLGTLHGLGMASEILSSATSPSKMVSALFLANSGVDVGNVVLLMAAFSLFQVSRSLLDSGGAFATLLLGTASMFVLFATLREGSTESRASAGFMMMDVLPRSESASPANVTAPPRPTDESGRLTSPFMAYLIVEPYQVRHEVLLEMKSVGEWIGVDVNTRNEIPIERQRALTRELAKLIAARSPIRIDGGRARVASSFGEFVLMGANGALARETPVPEPLQSAVIGVTLVYETESIAESVSLQWGLFGVDAASVSLTVVDPSSVETLELSPDMPGFEWQNRLGEFAPPRIESIAAMRPQTPLASILLGIAALLALALRRARSVATFCLVAAYGLYPFARVDAALGWIDEVRIDRKASAEVIERLLTNVYRCFDIHNEEAIYDRLALTVTGEQLVAVYLESRRALELSNRGGARIRIDEVVVREVRSVKRVQDGGYVVDTVWTVGGSVNHFGHLHFRQNRYDAMITLVPIENEWKIQSIDLLQEKREL